MNIIHQMNRVKNWQPIHSHRYIGFSFEANIFMTLRLYGGLTPKNLLEVINNYIESELDEAELFANNA